MHQPPLTIERTYPAPAAAVFDAWTSEEVMRRWYHPRTDWTAEAEVDLRVGGTVRVTMREPGGEEHGGGGRYTEIDPPRRLAFTWKWDEEDWESAIEVEFAEADGLTTVRFSHSGLPDEATLRSHEEGWTETLDNLGRALAEAPGS